MTTNKCGPGEARCEPIGGHVDWCPRHDNVDKYELSYKATQHRAASLEEQRNEIQASRDELVVALKAAPCSTIACTTKDYSYGRLCLRCAALKKAGAL